MRLEESQEKMLHARVDRTQVTQFTPVRSLILSSEGTDRPPAGLGRCGISGSDVTVLAARQLPYLGHLVHLLPEDSSQAAPRGIFWVLVLRNARP